MKINQMKTEDKYTVRIKCKILNMVLLQFDHLLLLNDEDKDKLPEDKPDIKTETEDN